MCVCARADVIFLSPSLEVLLRGGWDRIYVTEMREMRLAKILRMLLYEETHSHGIFLRIYSTMVLINVYTYDIVFPGGVGPPRTCYITVEHRRNIRRRRAFCVTAVAFFLCFLLFAVRARQVLRRIHLSTFPASCPSLSKLAHDGSVLRGIPSHPAFSKRSSSNNV